MNLGTPPEIIPGWFPVTERENYAKMLFWWALFPLVSKGPPREKNTRAIGRIMMVGEKGEGGVSLGKRTEPAGSSDNELTQLQAASVQWLVSWYGMGKTSVESRFFNLPGKIGWMTMEAPGFLTLLYTMWWVGGKEEIEDLPWQNKVLAGLFVRF